MFGRAVVHADSRRADQREHGVLVAPERPHERLLLFAPGCPDPHRPPIPPSRAPPALTHRPRRGRAGGRPPAPAPWAGGASATGALVSSRYPNPTCTGPPLPPASARVTGHGTYPSGTLPVSGAGTYPWVVSYS